MKISILVAASENGTIGRAGDLPWHLPTDLKRFKRLTMGHCLLMGRKTFDTIGQALPGRQTVVLSRDPQLQIEGVRVQHSFNDALKTCEQLEQDELFVVGGAQIYRLALPHAQKVYLTRVHFVVEGDASFPELAASKWRLCWEEAHEPESEGSPAFTFQVWERVSTGLGSGQ
jgi:dihydrofolate reductase